jgi:hypothetical protein
MRKLVDVARNVMAIAGVLALGYSLGGVRGVKAAANDVEFQLAQVNESSSLLVYQPSTRTVYVYRGATAGSSNLQCSFKYVLGAPGGSIQRVTCSVPTAP